MKFRMRDHEYKTGGNWGEEGRRTSFLRLRHLFPDHALISSRAFLHLSESMEQAIFLVVFSVIVLLSFPLIFQFGDNSGLHLIIFDEFDAVCKSRYMYNVRTCTW